MKKVLILMQDILEGNSATDVLLEIAVSLKEQQQKVSLFVDNAQGGEVSERLRVKGVPVFDVMHGCYPSMEKNYDVLLAFDDWSIDKASLFKGAEKIKVGATSDPDNIVERVMESDEDFDEDEEDEEVENEISDEDKLEAVGSMVQCTVCGTDNTAGAAACSMCGAAFEGAPAQSKSEQRRKEAQKATGKKKSKKKKATAKKKVA
jgi:hypothetical protein